MPTQAQFNLLKPQDVGLSSFETLYQIPNLSPEEQSRLLTYLKQADAEKSGIQSKTGPTGGAVTQFKNYYQSLLQRQNAYVPPPATTAVPSQAPTTTTPAQTPSVAAVPAPAQMTPGATPAPAAPAQTVAAVPAPQSTAPSGGKIDFEAELMKLLGGNSQYDQKLQDLQLKNIEKGFNAPDFGPEDQKILDIANARARQEAQTRTEQGDTYLAGQNLTGGGAALRNYQHETDTLTKQILDNEVTVRTNALNRGRQTRQEAMVNSENFLRALHTNNAALASSLVDLYKAQTEAGLNERQLTLQEEAQREAIQLSRDQFTEDKRRAMRNEGFTEKQIQNAENQMLWQRAFNEKQQTADLDLANRNLDLQTKVQDRTLGQQDKALALQEIKDNRGYTLEKSMQDLQERQFLFNSGLEKSKLDEVIKMDDVSRQQFLQQMGFDRYKFDATQSLSRDQFESYAKELERRYGLDVNRFELEKALQTGELDWKILESQRRYDLDAEDQKQKWLASDAARQLQEKLGMTELEIKKSLGEGELGVARENQLLEKWMFQEGLNFEKYKFEKQLEAARKRAKGGFLGKLVKTFVGGAVGFFTGGGPVGALAGALAANGVDVGAIGGAAAAVTGGGNSGTSGGSATGDYVQPTAIYG